jgi:Holliday junction resolvasome RuvABC DNA-binding subunit
MKNVKFFSSIKGVGEKVAERIVSELKSEVGKLNVPYSEEKSNIEEIMLALRSLGYNQSEILKMISVAREQYANFDYLDTPKAIQICLSIYKK